MRRSKPALHLAHSPLVYVLTQIMFSAIVKMDEFIPDIQEELRHEGFPKFNKGQVTAVRLDPNAPPHFTQTDRWEFQDRDGRLGFVILPNSLVAHTSRYGTYEEFEETISLGLRVLGDSAGPNLVERIGLRYIDLIRPRENESFSDYLQPSLLGLNPAHFQATSPLHRYEFQGQTDVGRIVVRWSQNADAHILPPDLMPSRLQHEAKIQPGNVVGLLDLDHFTVDTQDFERQFILDKLQLLHDNLDLAFRSAVTEKSLKIWGNTGEQAC